MTWAKLVVCSVRRIPIEALLVLPVFFYLAVAVYWQWQDLYIIAGDERHYLLVTDSLVRDQDVLVLNNYFAEDTAVRQATGEDFSEPHHLEAEVRGQYSIRSIGLPLVVAVPYYLGGEVHGVAGARMFMALLAGFLPFLLYRAAYQVIGSRPWSVLIALTFASGLPFLAASNQIYPDLMAGMILLYVAERAVGIIRCKYEPNVSALDAFVVGILISFLPWLHFRFAAPAVVLLVGYVYAVVAAGSGQARRSRWWILTVATVTLSLALAVAYNYVAFGRPSGSFGGSNLSAGTREFSIVFLRFHWDRAHGMFLQQPFVLLGLVGIVPFIKANWRVALLLGMLLAAVLVPAAMSPGTGFGSAFAGRYWWAVVPLWIFPTVHAIELLLKRSRTSVLLVCSSSVLLQGLLVSTWLRSDLMYNNAPIYHGGSVPIWLSVRDFYSSLFDPDLRAIELWLRLPQFRDLDSYLMQPANYVIVLFGLLLIVSGWLWQRGATTRLIGGMWAVSLVVGVGVVALIPPALGSYAVPAVTLPGQVGVVEGDGRVAKEGKTAAGFLTSGPYLMSPAGRYEVKLEYESSGGPSSLATKWDIVSDSGANTIASGALPPSATNDGTFVYGLSLSEGSPLVEYLEVRVFYPGQGYLRVDRMTITPLNLD